ncbi:MULTISPECIES: hypothetical protein [Acinetobacter]|uniref:hypothetical protein n=1 Tax=Acinetobacter TaxID=469 RepID=UPI0015B6F1F7|nr:MULTISPECIES: hypothetical protein [Acinetobacter]MBT0888429.1 hypothetical protein [Acinetobacter towneri]NWJ93834.1 hypothetical protein [Acinetobacter sp. Swhac1]
MINYYELLKLDMNAAHDEINDAIKIETERNTIPEDQIRTMKSIFFNTEFKKEYDQRLMQFLLTSTESKKSGDTIISSINAEKISNLFNGISETNENAVHDKFIYIALGLTALNVIISSFASITFANISNLIFSVAIIVFLLKDWNVLNNFGKATFSKWWALFLPVYLYKRAKRLETKQKYFQIWLAFFVLWIIVFFTFIGSKSLLESSACDVVTDIVHNQFHQRNVSCESVTILESNGKSHDAIATLSNGNTVGASITELASGDIYVEIEQ